MLLSPNFVSSFFFASVVLADRHRENYYQPRFVNRVEQSISAASDGVNNYWAGAVWQEGNGTFDFVTGTLTVPDVSGPSGSTAIAWVGIDGYSCTNAILVSAVFPTVTENGTSYQAWYQWFPDPGHYFSNFSISAGDVIRVNVTAFSATTGLATIENLTNGQFGQEYLNSTHPLCRQNAEWVVADPYVNGTYTPLANFSTVTFTSAEANGPNGTYTPAGPAIVNIELNNQIMTSVSTNGSCVTIQYV